MAISKRYSILTLVLLSLLALAGFSARAQAVEGLGKTYQLFTGQGKLATWDEVVVKALQADAIMFGEEHDKAIAHQLELDLLRQLHERGKPSPQLTLAMEMFGTDDSLLLAEYGAGTHRTSYFEGDATLWSNYKTDYKPLVEYARLHQLTVVGSNVPRRYAGLVARRGTAILDSLSTQAKAFMPPLPLPAIGPQAIYAQMARDMGLGGAGGDAHQLRTIVEAQALRDASMARQVALALQKGGRVLHINGSYHSLRREGMVSYLAAYAPKSKALVITTLQQAQLQTLATENVGSGDFVLVLLSDEAPATK
jgi:uncharacterized iron-regulated protein